MRPSDRLLATAFAQADQVVHVGAREAFVIHDAGHVYVADASTGEIIHSTRPLPKGRYTREISVYVGSDTKWPSDARDACELLAATAPFDSWENNLYFSRDKVLDLLDNNATGNAARVLRHLAMNLVARNHWFGRVSTLGPALQMAPRTLERALSELAAINVIRRKNQGKTWPTRISIHPWYAWKGDLQGRDAACLPWIGLSSASLGGE